MPKEFDPKQIKLTKQLGIPGAQWIYTAGKNSEFLYVFGGNVAKGCYVAKLNSLSLEIIQKINLPPALYIGGLLIHKNG